MGKLFEINIWTLFLIKTPVNKLVRTKMRPKEGAKIKLKRDLSDSIRFVRFAGLDFSNLSDLPISAI